MKFISLFTKAPSNKRFSYRPWFYNEEEEERKERELRVKHELDLDTSETKEDAAYRTRITGSFRQAKKTVTPQADPSSSMLRLIILLFLTVWLVAVFQFGTVAIYAGLLFVPFYLYLKFRRVRTKD